MKATAPVREFDRYAARDGDRDITRLVQEMLHRFQAFRPADFWQGSVRLSAGDDSLTLRDARTPLAVQLDLLCLSLHFDRTDISLGPRVMPARLSKKGLHGKMSHQQRSACTSSQRGVRALGSAQFCGYDCYNRTR